MGSDSPIGSFSIRVSWAESVDAGTGSGEPTRVERPTVNAMAAAPTAATSETLMRSSRSPDGPPLTRTGAGVKPDEISFAGLPARIYRWYKELRLADPSEIEKLDADEIATRLAEVERIAGEVAKVPAPPSCAQELYALRLHIDYVVRRLEAAAGESGKR